MEVMDKFRGFRISSDLVFSVFVDFFCFDWEAFLRGLTACGGGGVVESCGLSAHFSFLMLVATRCTASIRRTMPVIMQKEPRASPEWTLKAV